ncbi:MAG: DNA polymerase IV [Acidimicrobiia bacterium]|nr:DNA polymerase IV [Acidimicrobiia bacterium]
MRSWILHVDLDQFLAAVEVLRRPELAGRPVVVGGDGNPQRARQVVATASYEARAFGVRSGMSLAAAHRRCPDAVFLPSDRPAYDAASAGVMATLRTFPGAVEVWGWDEAFVGVEADDPENVAAAIKERVLAATGLTCAVGIGQTKLQAKTATGFAKPGGIARLTRATWMPTMGHRQVTALWGVGPRTAEHLAELGIATVEDLARADHGELARRFGPAIGPHLRVLGLGGDDAPVVDAPHVARGRSREVTFEHDLADPAEIVGHVRRLAAEVADAVVAEGRTVTHVAVKVRTATFFTRTKISKLPEPTTDADTVAAMAERVLARFELTRPVRLLGVRLVLELPPTVSDAAGTVAAMTSDDPGAVPPDEKDWTWVLATPCPECGFDASTFDPATVPDVLRANAASWVEVLARRDVARRPEPDVWSSLEYACHVRDVFRLFDRRLAQMLADDDPQFANWDQDETAVAERYWAQDPAVVAAELSAAAATIADSFAAVRPDQWERPGRRSDGAVFTVDSFARYFVHDPVHHLHDVG